MKVDFWEGFRGGLARTWDRLCSFLGINAARAGGHQGPHIEDVAW
jgi:hypothetical protein